MAAHDNADEAVEAGSASGEVQLWCDHPPDDTEVVACGVLVAGWAHAASGIVSVDLVLDGGQAWPARLGVRRADVAAALKADEAANAGWTAAIPESELSAGMHELTVVATSASGQRAETTRRFAWRDLADGELPPGAGGGLSGERYDEAAGGASLIAVEHEARFRLAAALAPGRRVLDAGCGLGAGAAACLRAGASSVDAIDSSAQAVGQARLRHPAGVSFVVGDIRRLPYADASFELAVCFETIEHVEEHEQVLDELERVLAPGGVLLISSPNRGVYPDGNPWHVRELTSEELGVALRARFGHVALQRQVSMIASMLTGADGIAEADVERPVVAEVRKLAGKPAGGETYTVGVASDAPLPALPAFVVLGDPRDELVDAAIEGWTERALRAEAELSAARARAEVAASLADQAQAGLAEAERSRDAAQHWLRELEASASWRATAWLRAAKRRVRGRR